jgi:hypothetical protein
LFRTAVPARSKFQLHVVSFVPSAAFAADTAIQPDIMTAKEAGSLQFKLKSFVLIITLQPKKGAEIFLF